MSNDRYERARRNITKIVINHWFLEAFYVFRLAKSQCRANLWTGLSTERNTENLESIRKKSPSNGNQSIFRLLVDYVIGQGWRSVKCRMYEEKARLFVKRFRSFRFTKEAVNSNGPAADWQLPVCNH